MRVVDAVCGDHIFECRLQRVTRLAWSFDSTLLAVGSTCNQATSASVTREGNQRKMVPLLRTVVPQALERLSLRGLGFEKDGESLSAVKSNMLAIEGPTYENDG